MPPYADYLSELDDLANRVRAGQQDAATERALVLALSGGPMAALRRSRPIATLRADGTFFTGRDLTAKLWERAIDDLDRSSVIVDPAVGAGDLLLPPARRLHELKVEDWPSKLVGLDVDEHFIAAARSRLRLATDPNLPDSAFIGMRFHDFFSCDPPELASASHVVMNPPYVRMTVPGDVRWGDKTVNAAAVFVERSLAAMRPGARLLAVLPDVLRSGSRYETWRSEVANASANIVVEELGQFDAETDVHVFILDVIKGGAESSAIFWPSASNWDGKTVGDHFHVHVGAVVPHRHDDLGKTVPFAAVREIARWSEVAVVEARRGFSGRLDPGPLVLVRRTSRPGDRHRAQASLYLGAEPIAVENHLLVLSPRSGGADKCRELLRVLKNDSTNAHLDRVIRLRHLTVAAVGSIPWEQQ